MEVRIFISPGILLNVLTKVSECTAGWTPALFINVKACYFFGLCYTTLRNSLINLLNVPLSARFHLHHIHVMLSFRTCKARRPMRSAEGRMFKGPTLVWKPVLPCFTIFWHLFISLIKPQRCYPIASQLEYFHFVKNKKNLLRKRKLFLLKLLLPTKSF